jgi:hypothetical protein
MSIFVFLTKSFLKKTDFLLLHHCAAVYKFQKIASLHIFFSEKNPKRQHFAQKDNILRKKRQHFAQKRQHFAQSILVQNV